MYKKVNLTSNKQITFSWNNSQVKIEKLPYCVYTEVAMATLKTWVYRSCDTPFSTECHNSHKQTVWCKTNDINDPYVDYTLWLLKELVLKSKSLLKNMSVCKLEQFWPRMMKLEELARARKQWYLALLTLTRAKAHTSLCKTCSVSAKQSHFWYFWYLWF